MHAATRVGKRPDALIKKFFESIAHPAAREYHRWRGVIESMSPVFMNAFL